MRGRPRLPSDIQELSGAWDKNPSRRRVDVSTEMPLDINSPPPNMTDGEIELWKEIVNNAPIRVLKNSDRFLVELAARALACARYDKTLSAAQRNATFTTAKGMLSLMGMTPADRSRVESGWDGRPVNDEDNDDEFARH